MNYKTIKEYYYLDYVDNELLQAKISYKVI